MHGDVVYRMRMSSIVLDSDGLIKLAKAGVLEVLARRHTCWLADAVYRETVAGPLREEHAEARHIQALLDRGLLRRRRKTPAVRLPADWPEHALGAGEEATYRLFLAGRHALVLTDDRAFLRYLDRHDVPCTTPAAALVRLRETGAVSRPGALDALTRLRPLIRRDVYWTTLHLLESRP